MDERNLIVSSYLLNIMLDFIRNFGSLDWEKEFLDVRTNAFSLKILKQRTKKIAKLKKNQTHQELEGGENPNIKLILDYETPPKEMKTI